MERDRAVRRGLLVGVMIGLVAAVIAVMVLRQPAERASSLPLPGDGVYADLQVEVLNASGIYGLARDVTGRLRRDGVDVVYFGTASTERDSTVLLVRRGDSTRGVAIRGLLGVGQVVVATDLQLLLEVSVVLGRDAAHLGRDP